MIDIRNDGHSDRLPTDLTRLLVHLEQYLKLEAIDKLSVTTTIIIVAGVIIALSTSAVFFLSTGLVKSLSSVIGNEALAHYIVGGILVLIIVVFYMNRKKWVEDRVVRNISHDILSAENENDENAN